jgi:hypothetical protein
MNNIPENQRIPIEILDTPRNDNVLYAIRNGSLESISIGDDISLRIDFHEAKITWVIQHPANKSVTFYLTSGIEIHGKKTHVSNTLTSVNWSQPKTGFALIN